ncbi:MAG TPA: CocE/NonD family hydrolase [Amycolatopsis sp.]|uniref:CocE/NonD family hydrolase n=1 Tax=Amycolatopsis sp. TaxID=37632 RepID=UPI002B4A962B|nr:CocE/NonD family hydrolase [Amycolatopsis sp.]HKS47476.1 CocE/NonD family hydrolase [Amycolatopsis sp.]
MRILIDTDILVPGHDGTPLAANVWRPDVPEPAPVLLARSPYGKDDLNVLVDDISANVHALVEAGYAVVYQSCRGTFRSEGTFTPHVDEAADGAAAVAWLREQPWCNGTVGMLGTSYVGLTQWYAAATGVEGLAAIAPLTAPADPYLAPWYSPGGALSLDSLLTWTTLMSTNAVMRDLTLGKGDPAEIGTAVAHVTTLPEAFASTPLHDHAWVRSRMPALADILAHPTRDRFWTDLAPLATPERISVPALNVGGWYDLFLPSTLQAYRTMRERGGSAEARAGQRLVIGPWAHMGEHRSGTFPDRDHGPMAAFQFAEITEGHVAFFDRWLRGRADAVDDDHPVRIFVMGIDEWRDEADWPLPDTRYTDYHLSSTAGAHTAAGDGLLSVAPPAVEGHDTYLYDPHRPVPSLGGPVLGLATGTHAGPLDQRPVESRDDVLCFTTPELTAPVEVTGHVAVKLFVSSSAVDTDFTGKLVDVHPDGRAVLLCEGILRARYRRSLAEPEPLTPGEVTELTVDLGATSNVFLPGHRIRLEVSSSNFPRYDRNSNTGGVIAEERLADMVPAVNAVHHGPAHPSRLVLPLIER